MDALIDIIRAIALPASLIISSLVLSRHSV